MPLPPRVKPAGWRGGDLLTLAVVWLAVAASIMVNPDPESDLFHTRLPVAARVLLWAVPAGFAAWAAYRVQWQALAFGLLMFPCAERLLGFLGAATYYGNQGRLTGVVVYGAVLWLVYRMAERPEPTEPPLPPPLDSLGGDSQERPAT